MEKKKYYLSIHSGPSSLEIRDVKGDSTYDFEIEASQKELDELEKICVQAGTDDFSTFVWVHAWADNKIEKLTEGYDESIQQVYQMIYNLGTEQTKNEISKMGILDSLNN